MQPESMHFSRSSVVLRPFRRSDEKRSRSGEYARKRGAGVPGGCGSDWKLVVLFRKIAGKQEFHRKNNRKSNFRGTMDKFTAYKTCPAALSDSSSPAPDR